MVKITYINVDGAPRTVEAEVGSTVMETAIQNGVPGIEAECGGACACSTRHVYVEEAWREKTGEPAPAEEDQLDFGFHVRPDLRLTGHNHGNDALDGLVRAPAERQGQTRPRA